MDREMKLEEGLYTEPVGAVAKTIFSDVAKRIGTTITEIGLDNLLKSDIVKELPIADTLKLVTKFSLAVRDRHLLKKTLTFIAALNEGNVDPKEIEKRRKAVQEKKKWIRDEIERLTIHLDRIDETQKAKLTGAFYAEYLNGTISWDEFREFMAIIERVFLQDFKQVLDLQQFQKDSELVREMAAQGISSATMKRFREASCERLMAVGLVNAQRKPMTGGISSEFNLTGLGKKFGEVLVKINWREGNF